jgi:hypothetical protein
MAICVPRLFFLAEFSYMFTMVLSINGFRHRRRQKGNARLLVSSMLNASRYDSAEVLASMGYVLMDLRAMAMRFNLS